MDSDMYLVTSQTGCIQDPNDDFCDKCERTAIHKWQDHFPLRRVTIESDYLVDNGTLVHINIAIDDNECTNVTLKEKFQLDKDGRFIQWSQIKY